MNVNPLTAKIAAPYARALYDYSINQNIMHQITADFQNLEIFLETADELTVYLKNPLIMSSQKQEILNKTLKTQLNTETFKFLSVLVKRDRINLLESIIQEYLELVCKTASIRTIEIDTAFPFTNIQKNNLIKKLKKLTNSREIRLIINLDSTLIGGFIVKTESKRLDFTIINKLQKLAKHLDGVLTI
uniref:ATP synthase subunit delta, chloroplastic n=1 Tax=Toxarium undulatum TaxID=210620 RepID=A0A1D8D9J0_9STRA|nr:ATP synthase CF1 subunit delta [Toxarium undulatum]AOS86615.1 ATP synthase CF1 subunit delta [Toxarium undulatum]